MQRIQLWPGPSINLLLSACSLLNRNLNKNLRWRSPLLRGFLKMSILEQLGFGSPVSGYDSLLNYLAAFTVKCGLWSCWTEQYQCTMLWTALFKSSPNQLRCFKLQMIEISRAYTASSFGLVFDHFPRLIFYELSKMH